MKNATLFLAAAALMASTAIVTAAPTAKMKEAVADSARPSADTARDENRKPAQMLEFGGITPGKIVVDMLPGGGYFTRIFAKAVEPGGRVYAYFSNHNDEALKKQGRDPDNLMADLKRVYKNLGVIHGPLSQFVTPEPVDVVWTSLNYHDLHNKNFGVDVNEVNKAIFKSLKPGGLYVVLDHAAADSAPADVTSTLHRIKKADVVKEVEAAGFKLVAEGDALHYATDDGTKRVFENDIRGKTNQFMLKFQKPRR
jgi:predicted methyltransferase